MIFSMPKNKVYRCKIVVKIISFDKYFTFHKKRDPLSIFLEKCLKDLLLPFKIT